jgi:hypothetical protein
MKDFTLDELKESTPCQISDNPVRYMLPSWYDSRGEKGGYIFDDPSKALEFKEIEIRNAEYRLRVFKEREEKEEKEKAEQEKFLASFNGFLSSDRMKAGKQLKTLTALIRWEDNDGLRTGNKKEYIERKIELGYVPKIDRKAMCDKRRRFLGYSEDKTEFLLWNEAEQVSSTINKTEYDYAVFLTEKQ